MQAGTTPNKRTSISGRNALKLKRLDGARRSDQAASDAHQGEFVHCTCTAAGQLGRKRHRMPIVTRPRWQVVVLSHRRWAELLVSGQPWPLQGPFSLGQGPRRQPAPCTASPAAAAYQDRRHNTEAGLDRADPRADEQAASGDRPPAAFARAAAIASQADEAVEVVDAALDHSSHRDRAGGRRIRNLVQELQKTADELAGAPVRPSRPNGGQHHTVVTPRVEANPDRSDVPKLGETIDATLVQAAQEHANHASLLEQTKWFADFTKVAEKSRELAEMNEWLIALARMEANCGTDTENRATRSTISRQHGVGDHSSSPPSIIRR